MNEAELIEGLHALGVWRPGLRLEEYGLLPHLAPEGALQSVQTFMLNDENYAPARGQAGRPWRPVAIIGPDILMDPSPMMLEKLLLMIGYWDRPDEFGDILLTQLHRFALDFYEGYEVREEQFDRTENQLIIAGSAAKADSYNPQEQRFKTCIRSDQPATFVVEPQNNLFD